MAAQGPDDEEGDCAGSEADGPEVVVRYFVVAVVAAEVRDARVGNPIYEVFVEKAHPTAEIFL